MREYANLSPRFWTGETGRQIRKLGPRAQVVALYLISAPTSNLIGLYYLPTLMIAHDTGCTQEDVSDALESLSSVGFAFYDDVNEVIWVPSMARFQVGETCLERDRRHKAIVRECQQWRKSPFYDQFMALYSSAFNLVVENSGKGLGRGIEGASENCDRGIEGASKGHPDLSQPLMRTGTGTGTGSGTGLDPRVRDPSATTPAPIQARPERPESTRPTGTQWPVQCACEGCTEPAAKGPFCPTHAATYAPREPADPMPHLTATEGQAADARTLLETINRAWRQQYTYGAMQRRLLAAVKLKPLARLMALAEWTATQAPNKRTIPCVFGSPEAIENWLAQMDAANPPKPAPKPLPEWTSTDLANHRPEGWFEELSARVPVTDPRWTEDVLSCSQHPVAQAELMRRMAARRAA